MTFHWPFALLALPVALAVLLALFARSHGARRRLLAQFAAARLLPALLASYSPGLRRLKHVLVIAGVLLVVLALARPQWGYDWQQQRARGVDVIFVIDTSKSMLTQDVLPDRLDRAKLAIMDLVEKMEGNRVGLVAFAGQAFLQCPLTLDYDAFRQSLEAVDTGTIARGGTNIAAGINEAAAALEDSGNHKVIVLVTDGEDLEGQGIAAAKSLRDQGVIIYTVGVGTPQGDIIPIPGKDGQMDFVRDENGNIVKSHLDAATLTAISQATNGFYEPLGATGEGLTQVYEAGIKSLPQQQLVSSLDRQPIERFQWPLALGLLLLALDPLIGTRRLFRTQERRNAAFATANLPPLPPAGKPATRAATAVVTTLVLAATWMNFAPRAHAQPASAATPDSSIPSSTPASPAATSPIASTPPTPASTTPDSASPTPVQANSPAPSATPPSSPKIAEELYQHGDYKDAAAVYGQAADANPQDARFRYDEGASLYRGGDYDAASQAFQQTLSANDLNLQQHAYYGMGNAQYRVGQAQLKEDPKKTVTTWDSALKDYQNAIDLNPNDADAHYNYGLLKKELDELKKQLDQQQKQQQQQQQNQQNQQNQSQQNQQNQSQQDQQNQPQQNQQQNQQNQSGQQGRQQSQNQPQQPNGGQQSQQNQQQSQKGGQQQQPQQGQSGNPGQNQPQNQNSGSPQNQQNQSSQQQNQSQEQNGSTTQPNQSPGQSQQQNSAENQNQPGQKGSQPQPQPAQQNQNSAQSQQPNGGPPKPQPQSNGQASPQSGANPQQPNSQGMEPAGSKPGQQQAKTGSAAGGAATGEQASAQGNATASASGAMTRDEARQVLDSLKNSERKLPATDYDAQKDGAQPSSDQAFKDW